MTGFLTLTAINDLGGVQSDMTDDQTAAAEKKGRHYSFIWNLIIYYVCIYVIGILLPQVLHTYTLFSLVLQFWQ